MANKWVDWFSSLMPMLNRSVKLNSIWCSCSTSVCIIYQAGHFDKEIIPCRQQMGSSAVLWACRSTLVLAASTRCLRWAHSIGRGCRVHTCVMVIGADFIIYLLHQFCLNRVNFFTIHRRHRCKKLWTRILKFLFCNFWQFFLNFQKGVARSLCG